MIDNMDIVLFYCSITLLVGNDATVSVFHRLPYFFTLLPSCYCEWISLDLHPHNQHIQKAQASQATYF